MGHVLRARILMTEDKLNEAIAELQHQVADTPELAMAHYTLGLAHWRKGDTTLARGDFQNAIKAAQDMVLAWKALAELHLSTGDIQIAKDYAQRAVQLDPVMLILTCCRHGLGRCP